MKLTLRSGPGVVAAAVFTVAFCQGAPAQTAPGQEAASNQAKAPENKGLPARATPGDYQAHAQLGAVTLAAEFTGHSVNTPGAVTLATEDYVVVEVAFLGSPDTHVTLSDGDFSLRINGKKALLPQSYLMLLGSLKDPEWVAPEETAEKKAGSTSIGGGGGGQQDPTATPKVYHPPFALARQWQQIVQKGSLPEGDRTLPAAGLIFFKYHGKSDDIDSIDLSYKGSAGKAVLKLHP